jgi:hypothetical protein
MNEDELVKEVMSSLSKIPSLRKSYNDMYTFFMGFYHAVAWKQEIWLLIWLSCLPILLLSVFLFRKRFIIQGILFALMCALVISAEKMNSILAINWSQFSTQNYFDKRGVFASVVFAGPLLVILFIQVIVLLREAALLVVQVKRMELRRNAVRRIQETRQQISNGNGQHHQQQPQQTVSVNNNDNKKNE